VAFITNSGWNRSLHEPDGVSARHTYKTFGNPAKHGPLKVALKTR
jgi:hypothetical protein